jgi:diaminohydroxyphosphoribosylaminopyrimidine deaminase / 5-amino-6-(5-phosphoribosylamino)uracil reductase
MSAHATDEKFLQQALDLARIGIGLASPNPYVGAVIVDKQGTVAGTAAYTYETVTHAEVLALTEAGERSRGGTLYINLEPHAHQGRTPPCTDALITAGIRRVVACMADPNPKVSGRGFEQLRSAGIRVEVGVLEAEARRLNEAFARHIQQGVPLVTLKSAMTLDGKIAARAVTKSTNVEGGSPEGWITGGLARAHVHEQRHQSDAILVGVGTILADDPLLTDRSGKPRRRPLLRVVLDSHLRLPLDSRLVRSISKGGGDDVLVFYSSAEQQKKHEFEKCGVRAEQVPSSGSNGRPDLHFVLRRLGELEITSLMIEGGSTINGMALASAVVDKVFLYYAPKMVGDDWLPFATESLAGYNPVMLKDVCLHRFGEDIAVEGYLRDPYGLTP